MAISVSGLTTHTQTGGGTWKDYGGGGGSGSNADVFFSSTSSRGRKVSNGIKGFAFEVNASGTDLSNTVIVIRWATLAGVGSLDTRANSGVVIRLEDTSGNTSDWAVDGSDTYGGGWRVSVIDTSASETSNSGTAATLTAIRYVGVVWDETASVGGGDDNCYIDEILSFANTGLTVTGNTTDLIEDLLTWDEGGDYGLFEERAGIIFSKANFDLQPDASDMSATGSTLIFENPVYYDGTNISACLSEIGLTCSDADNVTLTRCTITAHRNTAEITGTDSNREFDISGATDFDLDTCSIVGFDGTNGVALGDSGQAIDFTTFNFCGKVTAGTAVIRDCIFRNATDATGAFFYDEDSDIADCIFFSDGTGYGIHYRPTGAGPFTETFDGIEMTGYGANETANAAIHVNPVTTTVTITINVQNASTPTTDEDAGYTGTFLIQQTVTVKITANDANNNAISGARVYVEAASGGDLPAGASVTITRSGSTASVAHTAHGMVDGQEISIKGADQDEYNIIATITNVTTNAYDYTVAGSPTTPATGTITSTAIILNDDTNGSGIVQDAGFSFTSDQPIAGRVRKGTTAPYYKTSPVSGTITSSGLDLTVFMVGD